MFAIVDKDALDDLDSKPKFKPLYENNKHLIFALPFTPEVWIIDSFEKANANVRKQYKHEFGIDIASIIGNTEYTKQNCKKPRELAKKKYNVVCQLTAKAKLILFTHFLLFCYLRPSRSGYRMVIRPVFS